jgi:hypothetical protein
VLIQRAWRSKKQAEAWRQCRRKIVLSQSSWQAKQACLAYDKYRHSIILVQSLWRGNRALQAYRQYRCKVFNIQLWWQRKRSRQDENEAPEATASAESDIFSEEWRSIIQRISSIEAVQDCQEFCRQIRNPIAQIDVRADQGALNRIEDPHTASESDRRLAQLKVLIRITTRPKMTILALD